MPLSGTTTILVVEDEALVRMHSVDIFESAGFDVIEAADADEAIVVLGRGNVHLLFSDIDMPGSMDGLGLAQLVHERWPDVRLLLTSGHHRVQDSDVPGHGQFVRKPWMENTLVATVRGMLHT
jgi:DNA-binding NtrC family response regulator